MYTSGVRREGPLDPWRDRFDAALARGDEDFVAERLDAWARDGAIQEHIYADYFESLSGAICAAYPHLARHQANRALGLERVEEALDWLRIAREALDPEDTITGTDLTIDEALVLREDGRWSDSIALLDDAEALAALDRQKLRIANMRAVIAISWQHDYTGADQIFESILALARQQADKTSLLTALINRALSVHRFAGRFDRMQQDADEVVRLYRGDVPDVDRIYIARIRARAAVESCAEGASQALADYANEARTSPWARSDALVFEALHAVDEGRTEGVEDALRQVEEGSTPASVDLLLAACIRLRAEGLQGRPIGATLELVERRMHSEPFWRCWGLADIAHSLLLVGDRTRAEHHARGALELANRHGFAFEAFIATTVLAASSEGPERCARAVAAAKHGGYADVLLKRFRPFAEAILQAGRSRSADPDYEAELLDRLGSRAIRVSLFGGLAVWIGTERVEERAWSRPKSRALFAFLVLRQGRPATYDEAALALWPDLDERMARQSLLNAMTHVRKALGPDIFETGHNVIRLRKDLWIDLAVVMRASSLDESTREIVRQPLLPEYAYEDWFADGWMAIDAHLAGLISP